MKWTRGPSTEETSRRLVHAAEYEAKEPKSKKRKALQESTASASTAAPKRARAVAAEPESESGSESEYDSEEFDQGRGEVRDRFTGKLHHDTCGNCGEGGTLFECDCCDCAYHKECTKLPDGDGPPDDYKCYQFEAETQEVQHSAPSIAR